MTRSSTLACGPVGIQLTPHKWIGTVNAEVLPNQQPGQDRPAALLWRKDGTQMDTLPRCGDYLRCLFVPSLWKLQVAHSVVSIPRRRLKPDVLVGRGVSGVAIVPAIAAGLNLPWVVCRKPSERGHSNLSVEGPRGFSTFLIVDDFIYTGCTVRMIVEDLRAFCPSARCLGVFESQKYQQRDRKLWLCPIKEDPNPLHVPRYVQLRSLEGEWKRAWKEAGLGEG